MIQGCHHPRPSPMAWYAMKTLSKLCKTQDPAVAMASQKPSNPTSPPHGVEPVAPQLQVGFHTVKETCPMEVTFYLRLQQLLMLVFTEHDHRINDYVSMCVKLRVRPWLERGIATLICPKQRHLPGWRPGSARNLSLWPLLTSRMGGYHFGFGVGAGRAQRPGIIMHIYIYIRIYMCMHV